MYLSNKICFNSANYSFQGGEHDSAVKLNRKCYKKCIYIYLDYCWALALISSLCGGYVWMCVYAEAKVSKHNSLTPHSGRKQQSEGF